MSTRSVESAATTRSRILIFRMHSFSRERPTGPRTKASATSSHCPSLLPTRVYFVDVSRLAINSLTGDVPD